MSTGYRAVQWTPFKLRYDRTVAAAVVGYLLLFVATGKLVLRGEHGISDAILVLRALGTCAYLMLTTILCIGPLARLDRRFLPLLYNRRHFGVATFGVAALHAGLVLGWYHGFGTIGPLRSLFTSSVAVTSPTAFPFELPGVAALVILFAMAATSHDFWLANLSPRRWKWLHMAVYPAWALLVAHVALGALQSERNRVYVAVVVAGATAVVGLHVAAGFRERRRDRAAVGEPGAPWVDVAAALEVPEGRARVACVAGVGRVALVRHRGRVSALSNACAHQGGPLGEGRVIDGCLTCPWHGYQYRPRDGQSPPPFTEKVPTYRLRVVAGRVQIDPRALPAGTTVEPVAVDATPTPDEGAPGFFVGYLPTPPVQATFTKRVVAGLALLGASLAVLLAAAERDPGPAVWRSDRPIAVEGTLADRPYPLLFPADGGMPVLLVATGKRGAADKARSLAGRRVRATGTVLHRDPYRMLELVEGPESLVVAGDPDPVAPPVPVLDDGSAAVVLEGEVVDPKCWLGAMKPGDGKPHRACAILCLRGGIPPMLVARPREPGGPGDVFLLLDRDGGPIEGAALLAVLDVVGVGARVRGVPGRLGTLPVVAVEPGGVGRIEPASSGDDAPVGAPG